MTYDLFIHLPTRFLLQTFKKNFMVRGRTDGCTDVHTDIATTRLNQPRGQFSENYPKYLKTKKYPTFLEVKSITISDNPP